MLKRFPKGGTPPGMQSVTFFTSSAVAKLTLPVLSIDFIFLKSILLFALKTHMQKLPLLLRIIALAPVSNETPLTLAAISDVGVGSCSNDLYFISLESRSFLISFGTSILSKHFLFQFLDYISLQCSLMIISLFQTRVQCRKLP